MDFSIHIQNLSFRYPDGTTALQGVSLSVKPGEAVGIVGSNGAGKSTLVNHLNGYHLPQQGSVEINGITASKKTREQIRRSVGVIFQNADDQLFMPRLYDDVAFGPINLGVDQHTVAHEVEGIMADLNLWELRNRPPFHMSQGQKRFAAFATILVMHPAVVVMDEPTSDLDPRNRRKLIGLVNGLKATRLTVSHDLDFIWDTCQRVVVLSAGKIVADGPAQEILSSQETLQTYGLELPLRLQK
jgi:cobalt/nickel transport system ATP-binding protein